MRSRKRGERARRKGEENEDRVLHALRTHSFPEVESFRLALPEEEVCGIDVVVRTVYGGILRIQVKSSKFGCYQFLRKQRGGRYNPEIIVIIANCRNSDLVGRMRYAIRQGIQSSPRMRLHTSPLLLV